MNGDNGTQVEQVKPYGEGAKTEQVRQMFDSIAVKTAPPHPAA